MIDSNTLLLTNEETSGDQRSPLAVLRRFARAVSPGKAMEKCELCSTRLPAEHHHLVDLRSRRLVCCCEPCGLLFSSGKNAKYRRVPLDIRPLPDFHLSDAQWESLLIPINLAFFYRPEDKTDSKFPSKNMPAIGSEMPSRPAPLPRTGEGSCLRTGSRVVAVYPSPAGPIESLLDLEAWQEIVEENPQLGVLQAEVEALLVNRLWGKNLYYIVPIDECYRLSGLIRRHWRGLSGGSEVWEEVGRYFDRLKEKSCSI